MVVVKVIVINLKKASNRRIFQEKQLKKLNLEYTILEAFSVKNLSNSIYDKHYHDWVRPLRKQEVACYFSHKKAWNVVIKFNSPALIIEDDALLSKYTPELLYASKKTTDVDMINLETRMRKKFLSRNSQPISDNFNISKLFQDRTGAAAYILFPSGAKKLIGCESDYGISLADAHITNCKKLISFQIEPAAAIQLDVCNYYNLEKYIDKKLELSSISIHNREKSNPKFKLKRITSQIKLGVKQLILLFRAEKRHVVVNTEYF